VSAFQSQTDSVLSKHISLIGFGRISQALCKGLINSGISPLGIFVSDSDEEKLAEAKKIGVNTSTFNSEALNFSEIVFLCVKPKDALNVLKKLSFTENQVLVSVAAGITLKQLKEIVSCKVLRVMPNIAVSQNKGVCAYSLASNLKKEEAGEALELIKLLGFAEEVNENQMDVVTAVSGSGPAFWAFLIQKAVKAAEMQGLSKGKARNMVLNSLNGTVSLLLEKTEEEVIDSVSSPGGITEEELRVLENADFYSVFSKALSKAVKKSKELQKSKAILLEEKFGARNYSSLPVVITKAKGCWVEDEKGKKYFDCLSAYSALNQGHNHSRIVNAAINQMEKLTLTSRAFYNDILGIFLKELVDVSGMEKALPMNSGAEAVETAIKAARKWGHTVKGIEEGKANIIVCKNNFHGRTTTIVGFSSEEQYKKGFGPFCNGFKLIEFNNAKALEEAIDENTAAFLIEPIQGEGGIIFSSKGYLKKVREICSRKNVLFMLDEIQTGFGRTGKMFAFQHENIKPDILIVGKALGGGILPVSAMISSKEVMDVFKPGDHGSTFGGNPLACAVGLESIKVTKEENLCFKSAVNGEYFLNELKKINSSFIKEIRGKGLFIGLEIKKEVSIAKPFCLKLLKEGVLCKETHEQVIRLAPPLIASREELDWVVEKVRKVFLND